MRLRLREGERLPDPAPLATDDRVALAVGTALWIVAFAVAIVVLPTLTASGHGWMLAMSVVGIVLGAIGLVYSQLRRARLRRAQLGRARARR